MEEPKSLKTTKANWEVNGKSVLWKDDKMAYYHISHHYFDQTGVKLNSRYAYMVYYLLCKASCNKEMCCQFGGIVLDSVYIAEEKELKDLGWIHLGEV